MMASCCASQSQKSARPQSVGILRRKATEKRPLEPRYRPLPPVFRFARHCQRVDAVYHPVFKRYLLIVGYGHTGGWGLYEAPHPWGPWSKAFHTEYWGLGETHGYRLPAKWISADGRSAALVFSGLIYNGVVYDAFCVRKLQFEILAIYFPVVLTPQSPAIFADCASPE